MAEGRKIRKTFDGTIFNGVLQVSHFCFVIALHFPWDINICKLYRPDFCCGKP